MTAFVKNRDLQARCCEMAILFNKFTQVSCMREICSSTCSETVLYPQRTVGSASAGAGGGRQSRR